MSTTTRSARSQRHRAPRSRAPGVGGRRSRAGVARSPPIRNPQSAIHNVHVGPLYDPHAPYNHQRTGRPAGRRPTAKSPRRLAAGTHPRCASRVSCSTTPSWSSPIMVKTRRSWGTDPRDAGMTRAARALIIAARQAAAPAKNRSAWWIWRDVAARGRHHAAAGDEGRDRPRAAGCGPSRAGDRECGGRISQRNRPPRGGGAASALTDGRWMTIALERRPRYATCGTTRAGVRRRRIAGRGQR